ncbi:MAG: BPL-N domain-containing protein [Syntrophales bacterium]
MAAKRTEHISSDGEASPRKPCALLWDESFLWGVMARRALREAGLPFDLLRSGDVRGGALSRYRMLFVPGGWAGNKLGALGDRGCQEIRRFVAAGGSYLGICGGAGMATQTGLGLLPIRRKPSQERVPSFSGPILLSCDDHAIWRGIDSPRFCAWWPSQFQGADPCLRIPARYGEAQTGAFSSDIPAADGGAVGWPDLERRYGILLDPARLAGEPAVVEGTFGGGKVLLSLVHFDTPGDRPGAVVLRNLWQYLASSPPSPPRIDGEAGRNGASAALPPHCVDTLEEIQRAVRELIDVGSRNFLWYWRNPLILQWRRGVRGLEYATLAVMAGEIARCLGRPGVAPGDRSLLPDGLDPVCLTEELREIRELLTPFCKQAGRLLVRERFSLMTGPLSPVECADGEIGRLRQKLFGQAMSHGGLFKGLIDRMDSLLYRLFRSA